MASRLGPRLTSKPGSTSSCEPASLWASAAAVQVIAPSQEEDTLEFTEEEGECGRGISSPATGPVKGNKKPPNAALKPQRTVIVRLEEDRGRLALQQQQQQRGFFSALLTDRLRWNLNSFQWGDKDHNTMSVCLFFTFRSERDYGCHWRGCPPWRRSSQQPIRR